MLNGLFDITESRKNVRKTPWSWLLDLFLSRNKGMLEGIFNFREFEKKIRL